MNRVRALTILEIDADCSNESFGDLLKKQYRIKALQYHPDKNSDPGSADQFREIKDAYEYLLEYQQLHDDDCEDIDESSYSTILKMFLKNIWKNEKNGMLFSILIDNIVCCCETKMLEMLEKLDNHTLIKIHDVFSKYRHVFHYSNGFLKYVEQVLSSKMKNDNCIILNPSIDDLFDCFLYKITEKNHTYYVPLWHHELVYDNSGCDLYVQCNPILEDHISLDNENNIHYFTKYFVRNIFYQENMEIYIGLRKFSFAVSKLSIKQKQTITLKHVGIPKICNDDVYNISKLGDVLIHIELLP